MGKTKKNKGKVVLATSSENNVAQASKEEKPKRKTTVRYFKKRESKKDALIFSGEILILLMGTLCLIEMDFKNLSVADWTVLIVFVPYTIILIRIILDRVKNKKLNKAVENN